MQRIQQSAGAPDLFMMVLVQLLWGSISPQLDSGFGGMALSSNWGYDTSSGCPYLCWKSQL